MDEINIQIKFKVTTEYGEYQDALYFTPSEYASIKDEEIERMKQERVDTWLQMFKNPQVSGGDAEREAQSQDEVA